MAITTTAHVHDPEKILFRKLMKARITCSNSIHELETLDGLTDDWDGDDEDLENAALDIHLQCEYGCKESNALHEMLTGLLSGFNAPGGLWTEIELRQENAVEATNEIIKVIEGLLSMGANPDLGLKEMKRRAQHVVAKLEALKDTFSDLESEVQACLVQAQKQNQVDTKAPL